MTTEQKLDRDNKYFSIQILTKCQNMLKPIKNLPSDVTKTLNWVGKICQNKCLNFSCIIPTYY